MKKATYETPTVEILVFDTVSMMESGLETGEGNLDIDSIDSFD